MWKSELGIRSYITPAGRLNCPMEHVFIINLRDLAKHREFPHAHSKALMLSGCLFVLLEIIVPAASDGNLQSYIYREKPADTSLLPNNIFAFGFFDKLEPDTRSGH